VFNQLVFASAVYVFFTNLLPGITFASDLYVLTGRNWGTIEVVFSTGLCGVVFSMLVDPLWRAHSKPALFFRVPVAKAASSYSNVYLCVMFTLLCPEMLAMMSSH